MSCGRANCEQCGKNITMSGSQLCGVCDPDMEAITRLVIGPKTPSLCADCFKVHEEKHGQECRAEITGVEIFNTGAICRVCQGKVYAEVEVIPLRPNYPLIIGGPPIPTSTVVSRIYCHNSECGVVYHHPPYKPDWVARFLEYQRVRAESTTQNAQGLV